MFIFGGDFIAHEKSIVKFKIRGDVDYKYLLIEPAKSVVSVILIDCVHLELQIHFFCAPIGGFTPIKSFLLLRENY
jgi:hypothetical protein